MSRKWGEKTMKEGRVDLTFEVDTVVSLTSEIVRARYKFPSNEGLFLALVEEMGELATAYLKGEGEERVRAEALQVAVVALRLFEEGDPAYNAAVPQEKQACEHEVIRDSTLVPSGDHFCVKCKTVVP